MDRGFTYRLIITGPETSRTHTLPMGATTIGRQPDNDLVLERSQVSRRHARVDCTPTECRVTDLGSSNGTYVDGKKLLPNTPVPMERGTVIRIGPYELTVEQTPTRTTSDDEALLVELVASSEPMVEPHPQVVDRETAPLPPAPPPSEPPSVQDSAEESPVPPGLSRQSHHLVNYLPSIYHTEFIKNFLGLFEAIMMPIKWTVDNFDLYLDPGTAPTEFLPWLANWFDITFDPTWSEAQRRQLLVEAHQIYARRGTRWALRRVLEIYTGHTPEINDGEGQEPFTFVVKLPVRGGGVDRALVEALIDANKPACTTYQLEFAGEPG